MGLFSHEAANRAVDSSGAGIRNAVRCIYPKGSNTLAPLYRDPDLTEQLTSDMRSDENGYFALCYLQDGEYRVEIRAPHDDRTVLYSAEDILVGSETPAETQRDYRTLDSLEADRLLSYSAGTGRLRVWPGMRVRISATGTQFCVLPEGGGIAQMTTAGGVRLCETGTRFTSETRFIEAVARGDHFSTGTTVLAGGAVYVFADDGNTGLPGLTGWRRVVSVQNDADLAAAKAKTDLVSVSQAVNLDVVPALVAASNTYDSVAAGLAGTSPGAAFFVQAGPGLQFYRNDAGTGNFLGWHSEIVFETAADLLATTAALPENATLRVRREGLHYQTTPATASDHHLTTAGGVKLYVQPANHGIFSLEAFAPAMDGTTDDTDAIQAALNAAAGKTLRLPRGKTLLTWGLKVPANTVLDLNGATLKKRPPVVGVDSDNLSAWTGAGSEYYNGTAYPPLLYLTGPNVTILGNGGTLDGNFRADTDPSLLTQGFGGSHEGTADRSVILGTGQMGLDNVTIDGVRFHDAVSYCINLEDVTEFTCVNCIETDSHALFMSVSAIDGNVPAGTAVVRNNRLHGTRELSLAPNCFVLTAYETLAFEGNIVDGRDKVQSIHSPNNNPDAPKFQSIGSLSVTNNTFYCSGVKFSAAPGFVGDTLTIADNSFITTPGWAGLSGITGGQSVYKNASVIGNTFQNCNIAGLEMPSNSLVLSGNIIRMTEQKNAGALYAAFSTPSNGGQTPKSSVVSGNVIDMGGFGGHVAFYFVHGFGELMVKGNIISGCDHVLANIAGSDYSASSLTIKDNSIFGCRTIGNLRCSSIKGFSFTGNEIGNSDTTAPSLLNGYSGTHFRVNLNSGTGTWGLLNISGNTIRDGNGRFGVEVLSSSGATLTHGLISGNQWYSVAGFASCFTFGTSTINVGSLAILDNIFGGHCSLSVNLTIANQVTSNNQFLNAGGRIYNSAANVSIKGGTATTVGSAGVASALPAAPEGYIPVSVDGTTRKIPFYRN